MKKIDIQTLIWNYSQEIELDNKKYIVLPKYIVESIIKDFQK